MRSARGSQFLEQFQKRNIVSSSKRATEPTRRGRIALRFVAHASRRSWFRSQAELVWAYAARLRTRHGTSYTPRNPDFDYRCPRPVACLMFLSAMCSGRAVLCQWTDVSATP